MLHNFTSNPIIFFHQIWILLLKPTSLGFLSQVSIVHLLYRFDDGFYGPPMRGMGPPMPLMRGMGRRGPPPGKCSVVMLFFIVCTEVIVFNHYNASLGSLRVCALFLFYCFNGKSWHITLPLVLLSVV